MIVGNYHPTLEWVGKILDTEFSCRKSSLAQIDKTGKRFIAGVVYDEYTGASITANIVIAGMMSKRFLHDIFDYPFNQLGVDRIISHVKSNNVAAIRFNNKIGFKFTAIIPGVYRDADMIVYTMLRDDCRFLEKDNG